MGEEHIVNRWIIYCPYTQGYVDHEISFVGTDEKEERIATCTGIDDCCSDCLFLLGSQALDGIEKKRSILCIQISRK